LAKPRDHNFAPKFLSRFPIPLFPNFFLPQFVPFTPVGLSAEQHETWRKVRFQDTAAPNEPHPCHFEVCEPCWPDSDSFMLDLIFITTFFAAFFLDISEFKSDVSKNHLMFWCLLIIIKKAVSLGLHGVIFPNKNTSFH